MNKAALATTAAIALGAAAAAGYWAGTRGFGIDPGIAAQTATAGAAPAQRRILYYRNPMGLPDTSPTPKKDPMGMDYIPVYEGEDESASADAAAGTIRIATEKVQKLGVRTEVAQRRALQREVRASGRVEVDERRVFAVSPKFEGWVERLHVNVTGQPVRRGQPLFEVYSPELISAQREYEVATQGVRALENAGSEARTGMAQLAAASLARLKNWDISEEQIQALARSGEARRTLTFRSPVSGIVTEKKALQGMRFTPGEALYQVADLSSVWVIADVYERDVGLLRKGAPAQVSLSAYPDRIFKGTVSYVYPTLNAATRTVPVRVELPNPAQMLKPAMFAQVALQTAAPKDAVTVPVSAVIDSGIRRIVLVQVGEGRFEPREVETGSRSDDYVEVRQGIREGEAVVVAANFLIDAESNLKAAVGAFGSAADGPTATPASGASAKVGHQGEGRIESIDRGTQSISIEHGPIASLNWPAMTMEFRAANGALLEGLEPGTAVAFQFVERKPGEWVITSLKARAGATPHAKVPSQSHAGR